MSEATAYGGNLIRNGQVQIDRLRRVSPADATALPPDDAHYLIPLSLWLAHDVALWRKRQHRVALLLEPDADLAALFAHSPLAGLQDAVCLMAIDFPDYTDGRGYSLAQLLRQPYGWTGELRAVGDVMIDTVHYLARCGFDSFLVKPGHDPRQALAALGSFTWHYQKSYRTPAQRSTWTQSDPA